MSIVDSKRQNTCPDWCQSKHSNHPDDGCHDGPVWPAVPSLLGAGFHAVQVCTGADDEYGTVVYLEAPGLMLTPEQARTAGLALLSAASWARDHSENDSQSLDV